MGDLPFLDGSFESVLSVHSLEHLRNPGEAVKQTARLLSPGGIVFIAVPNTASLQARISGHRWLHLDLPRHLVHL